MKNILICFFLLLLSVLVVDAFPCGERVEAAGLPQDAPLNVELSELLLHQAIVDRNVEGIMDLINRVDVNQIGRHGCTPLQYAVMFNLPNEVISRLLLAGARLEERDIFGQTAMFYCCSLRVFRLLLERGARVDATTEETNRTILFPVLTNDAINDYLNNLELLGDVDMTDLLRAVIDHGVDVNHLDVDGRSAWCYWGLDVGVLRMFLEVGVDPNMRCRFDGETMLHLLIRMEEHESVIMDYVRLALSYSADPDIPDNDGWLPYYRAREAGYLGIIELLGEPRNRNINETVADEGNSFQYFTVEGGSI